MEENGDWYDECAEIVYNAILDYHRMGHQRETKLGGISMAWLAAYSTIDHIVDVVAPEKLREVDVL